MCKSLFFSRVTHCAFCFLVMFFCSTNMFPDIRCFFAHGKTYQKHVKLMIEKMDQDKMAIRKIYTFENLIFGFVSAEVL